MVHFKMNMDLCGVCKKQSIFDLTCSTCLKYGLKYTQGFIEDSRQPKPLKIFFNCDDNCRKFPYYIRFGNTKRYLTLEDLRAGKRTRP